MRVVALLGGLGSQMFKYAFFLYLQEQVEDVCCISTIPFGLNKMWNGYELNKIFGIEALDLNDKIYDNREAGYADCIFNKLMEMDNSAKCYHIIRGDIYRYRDKNIFRKVHRKIKNIITQNQSYIDKYDEKHWKLKGNILYDEFNHTSDKYLVPKTTNLKDVFVFPDFNDDTNISVSLEMSECESVAMHIRRSDHLYDNQSLFDGGYYKRAVAYMKQRKDNLQFYIFSDEPEWCRCNLQELGFNENDIISIVDWNKGENSYRDMQLMTYCKHNILAISSFSWWGYYLSKRENKMVCAPEGYWFEVSVHL